MGVLIGMITSCFANCLKAISIVSIASFMEIHSLMSSSFNKVSAIHPPKHLYQAYTIFIIFYQVLKNNRKIQNPAIYLQL